MSEDININEINQQLNVNSNELTDCRKSEKLSMNYVLEQIEKVAAQNDYLYNTIQKLGEMSNSLDPGDIAGASKAEALGDVVKCRETTNQQLLKLYEKMYDDLKPKNSLNAEKAETILRYANELPPIQAKELMSEILSKVI